MRKNDDLRSGNISVLSRDVSEIRLTVARPFSQIQVHEEEIPGVASEERPEYPHHFRLKGVDMFTLFARVNELLSEISDPSACAVEITYLDHEGKPIASVRFGPLWHAPAGVRLSVGGYGSHSLAHSDNLLA